MRTLFLSLAIVCTYLFASAQPGIGVGNLVGMPFYLARQGYYSTPTFGANISAYYRPMYRRTYPSIHIGINAMQLPISNGYLNDLNLTCVNKTAMICLNHKAGDEPDGFSVRWGLGVSHINPDIANISANASSLPGGYISLTDADNNKTHPMMEIGISYLWRLDDNKPFFLGFNLQTRYIYMYDNDKYKLNTPSETYGASMGGHLLFPAAGAQLVYVFERGGY